MNSTMMSFFTYPNFSGSWGQPTYAESGTDRVKGLAQRPNSDCVADPVFEPKPPPPIDYTVPK